ncbi:MAG TPA: hypothetical protein VJ756_20720 [Terriglobales bacterium]|jgi:hypothetical protein|nr:hypothetical protein [Terriglobales bacterium]
MKTRKIVFTLAVCFIGTTLCFAQKGFMGTWKLNEAKSKFAPGATKNSTVTYEASADSVKVTVDGTDASGKAVHSEWTGKFDGKDYPVTGDPNSDMRSYDWRSAHHLSFRGKKDGKVTTDGTIALSPDGKTRTVTVTGKDAQGKRSKSTAVYDKE